MANIEHYIPFLMKWEASTTGENLSNEELFNKARTRAYASDSADSGGATMCGVTLTTYKSYRKSKGITTTTTDDLKAITYDEWRDILKSLYWDKWQADKIENQSLAELVVDWYWHSGIWGIKNPQQCLGVKNDGIVGEKTLAAINGENRAAIFRKIWKRRKNYYYGIVNNNSTQRKFLKGWLNRLNDQTYAE